MSKSRSPFLSAQFPIRINPNSPQARDLQTWWPLMGDLLDHGRTGIHLAPDSSGPARSWSGRGSHFYYENGNHIATGAATDIGGALDWTLCMWFRADTNDNNDSKFISFSQSTNYLEIDWGGPSPATSLDYDLNFGSAQGDSASGSWNDGQWHHLALRFEGGGGTDNVYLFVDGNQEASAGFISGTNNLTGAQVLIGYSIDGGNRRFEGDLSDIRIYNRMLSDQEIFTLYDEPWDLYELPRQFYINVPGEAPAGRTTRNTDSHPLGIHTGMAWRINQP